MGNALPPPTFGDKKIVNKFGLENFLHNRRNYKHIVSHQPPSHTTDLCETISVSDQFRSGRIWYGGTGNALPPPSFVDKKKEELSFPLISISTSLEFFDIPLPPPNV